MNFLEKFFNRDQAKIDDLKVKAKRVREKMIAIEERYDCGLNMIRETNSEYSDLEVEFDLLCSQLRELDPDFPESYKGVDA